MDGQEVQVSVMMDYESCLEDGSIAQVLKEETSRVPQGIKPFICVAGLRPEDCV